MTLNFQPKAGSVVYCDYDGFVVPEMIKKRPVIVISKHRHNSKLLTIVPISSTQPDRILDHHIEMDEKFCLEFLSRKKSWVKCDMINVVSISRLNLVRDKKSGIRHTPNIGEVLLHKIKESIKKVHNL